MTADMSMRPAFVRASASLVEPLTLPNPVAALAAQTAEVAAFLKALSHEGRLQIMCHLSSGEKSVSELEELLAVRQAAVSQQLARLRIEGLVVARREGKSIYYSIRDPRVLRTVALMHDLFCRTD